MFLYALLSNLMFYDSKYSIASCMAYRERSGSMVECLTRDRGARVRASPASLRCGPWARHIYPSLVLVQPRKTCPCLTERLLMGRKESNQTKQTNLARLSAMPLVPCPSTSFQLMPFKNSSCSTSNKCT